MTSIALLVGIWSLSCVQTQINTQQGYVRETYAIEKDGSYEFTRTWYEDANCQDEKDSEVEAGVVSVGKRLSGMFIQNDTYEADFKTVDGTEFGAVTINTKALRFARGFKNNTTRNTMVSFFEYKKQ